jgi:hypothetical protein
VNLVIGCSAFFGGLNSESARAVIPKRSEAKEIYVPEPLPLRRDKLRLSKKLLAEGEGKRGGGF